MTIKIQKKAEEVPRLYPGDRIEYSLTHELKINGDSSWVKWGASTSVQDGESATQAKARLQQDVETEMDKLITKTVDYVMSKEG